MSKFDAKLDADSLIYSLGHCESDGRTVHNLHQRPATNDLLAPRESDCSRMRRKVSSSWLPSYINVPLPVLEILNMARYFPDRPRIYIFRHHSHCSYIISLLDLELVDVFLLGIYNCKMWLPCCVQITYKWIQSNTQHTFFMHHRCDA